MKPELDHEDLETQFSRDAAELTERAAWCIQVENDGEVEYLRILVVWMRAEEAGYSLLENVP